MKETSIIRQLQRRCPTNPSVKLGIGDDSAVLAPSALDQLVCADMLMDGVHFKIGENSPEQIGHKALAVNFSDIAAMGGKALSAYVCLALPRQLAESRFLDRLYSGIESLAQRFQVAVAGGDTNIWEGPLVISVTVVGVVHPKGAISRSGALPGDHIFVTGPVGGSLDGHHLDFVPRLAEAKMLMDSFDIHSMIDLSDGLSKDLREICKLSGVAAQLEPKAFPLRGNLQNLPTEEALQKALSDGEDFELCFTVSARDAEKLNQEPHRWGCQEIGRITPGDGLYWTLPGNKFQLINNFGYEHTGDKELLP